jgi:hypothetical protein
MTENHIKVASRRLRDQPYLVIRSATADYPTLCLKLTPFVSVQPIRMRRPRCIARQSSLSPKMYVCMYVLPLTYIAEVAYREASFLRLVR